MPDRKWYWFPVFAILKLIAVAYLLGHHFRLWAYRLGVFPSRKLECRVISVGNLTLGGTSRGYGGRSDHSINVVCDGRQTFLSPDWVGDEAVMMAEKLKNIPILTGPDRYQTGRYALEHFGVDTLILDDGFQHLALKRDLDILLIDHSRPLGNGHLFPAGELREPAIETRRADIVCFSRYSGGPINYDTSL